jgi:ferritin-like metal-binding protein YciE
MEGSRLRHLYVERLRDLYSAEIQLVRALTKMAAAATSADLGASFERHLGQTREHALRLEHICLDLDESPKGKKCKGMAGLIMETQETLDGNLVPEELDATLIADAQRADHYQIAAYGCVTAYAELLGEDSAVTVLRQILNEEQETDRKLTDLSKDINLVAAESEAGRECKFNAFNAKVVAIR